MMNGQPRITRIVALAAIVTLGLLSFLRTASADVVNMDEFTLTLNGNLIFNDTFGVNQVLAGGNGTVLPSGINLPGGSPANYLVMGTVTENGSKAILDTAQGVHLAQTPPFFQAAKANIATLLTGPPSSPFSLTPNAMFTTTGLFDLTVPSTPGGFYQVDLSDRVPANMGQGDVISMQVVNCDLGRCNPSDNGPFIRLQDADALMGTRTTIAEVPLDTNNQQILFELSHPTSVSNTIFGSYAYVNNGTAGPLTQLGSYDGLFNELSYTQAGFAQLAPVPAPEPSSLALLASGVFGIGWLRRRKAAGAAQGGVA